MRVFIAGGSGAVGRRMLPLLTAAGHTVLAITRSAENVARLRARGVEALVCDILDRTRLTSVVRDAAADVIVHQVTDLPASMNPRQLRQIYERNNRARGEGAANLIAAAHAANVRRMVVQSMATWYRPEGSDIKTEEDPLWTEAPEPIGSAVQTVLEMESAVLRDIPIAVVLRYGAFYGPGTWYARAGDIAQRVRKRGFPIVGGGITSFIHVDDAASAAAAALDAEKSGIYNIVDDEPARASDWLPVYARALDALAPFRVPVFVARLALGKPLTEWVVTMRGASNRKAREELGWSPRYASWRQGFYAGE
jgi:nucleoside-diphosphate-sugar epimerase